MASTLLRALLASVVALAAVGAPTPARAQSVAWSQSAASGPSPRYFHAMAFDTSRGMAVLFGGVAESTNGETWEWNGTAWSQRPVSGPSPRYAPAMAYDSAHSVTVLFGGNTDGGLSDQTWLWNGTDWIQRPAAGPSPRRQHSMVYDAARGVTVLFGGYEAGGNLSGETWEWDGVTWSLRAINGPSPRYASGMAYDASRGVTVLFGGYTFGPVDPLNGETWEWNGTVWTQKPASGPSPRYASAMAYDVDRGVSVLFGGANNSVSNAETWEWNGTAWSLRVVSAPLRRYHHGMVYDTARGLTVLFGGFDALGQDGETWEMCAGPYITQQPTNQVGCPTGTTNFTVNAPGYGSISNRWQIESPPFGSNIWSDLADGPVVRSGSLVGSGSGSAANTYTFQHNGASLDNLRFRCIVANGCGSATSDPAQLLLGPADVGAQGGVPGHDGVYDNNDFVIFIAYFFSHLPAADMGRQGGVPGADGQFDNNDFIVFIDQFFAGC